MSAAKVQAYRDAVYACALAGQLLAEHDVEKLIADIEIADAAGPMFNPTLWMQKHEAMAQDRELLKAALPLIKFVRARQNAGGAG